jgi:hypothetical protein
VCTVRRAAVGDAFRQRPESPAIHALPGGALEVVAVVAVLEPVVGAGGPPGRLVAEYHSPSLVVTATHAERAAGST